VEKQMECRLAAGETEVLGEKTCPSATFVHHKIPHDQTRVLNPGRRGGKPATSRTELWRGLLRSGTRTVRCLI
jgi:hypothetical protein